MGSLAHACRHAKAERWLLSIASISFWDLGLLRSSPFGIFFLLSPGFTPSSSLFTARIPKGILRPCCNDEDERASHHQVVRGGGGAFRFHFHEVLLPGGSQQAYVLKYVPHF